jgi:hypothetical protein
VGEVRARRDTTTEKAETAHLGGEGHARSAQILGNAYRLANVGRDPPSSDECRFRKVIAAPALHRLWRGDLNEARFPWGDEAHSAVNGPGASCVRPQPWERPPTEGQWNQVRRFLRGRAQCRTSHLVAAPLIMIMEQNYLRTRSG